MYSEEIIERRKSAFLRRPSIAAMYPHGIPDYSVADAQALTTQILQALDPDDSSKLTRSLTKEESDFAAVAQVRSRYDAPWFLESFVWIDQEGHGIRRLYPLWESQRFVLKRLADLEYQHTEQEALDGLLVNVLKARQLGVSTLAQALVAHRIYTQSYIRSIAGSDVEDQATYLFRMNERIYHQLPFFVRPLKIVPYKAGRELHLGNGSSLKAAWGKTTRGALQDQGGKKGNIERGRTNGVVHISELATWDNPEQLDSSLLPGVPTSPLSLVLFESTAELAGDWWHRHWQACQEGTTPRAWSNIFIPWCVEPSKYAIPPPEGWSPSAHTLSVAATIARDYPTWTGESAHLTREQLYWYEASRAYYTAKNQLHQFLKEFPSNPEECFQYAGRSIFTFEEIERINAAARPLIDVWYVDPSRDIAELKRLPPDTPEQQAQLAADRKRYPPPVAPTIPRPHMDEPLVPAGYGFRRLTQQETRDLPSLRQTVFSIYEYPRLRGRRRYILGVDVGDGLGLDYSIVSVVREPSIEEPAEEVAQFVSNTVRPSQLAFIVDAIGHFYCDEDGIEACAAIELNNHGITVQDLLQLHLQYSNFYVWEVVDAADASSRFTKRIGWQTTTRTRPILLEKFHDAVTTFDPIAASETPPKYLADFRLNSPITRQELGHFVTEGLLGEAEHAKGQHDDAIFGAAIGYYVAYRLSGGESEPIAERRRRRSERAAISQQSGERPDWRNSPASATAMQQGEDDGDDDPDSSAVFFNDRDSA